MLPYVPSLVRVRPYNLIRHLAQSHEVTVLASETRGEAAAARQLRELGPRVHTVPLRLGEALRGCAVSGLRGEPLQAGYCRSERLSRALSGLLAEGRFDLVHVEHLRAAHLAEVIPVGMPAVYDSVDCISLLLDRTREASHSPLRRLLSAFELPRARGYEAHLMWRFARIAVTSAQDRAVLLDLAPGAPVEVVRNGVDLDYFQPVPDARREPATIVFSGKMSYHANVTALLHFVRKVFPLVRRSRPGARLRVVGSNPPASVRALASDPHISVTGFLPDLRWALGGSTVAVCPVRVKAGVQNKLLEALAMGLPVVSTSAGVQGLDVEPGRDLLVADDPAEFADQLCWLLGDPARRAEIGQSGRAYAERHHRWSDAARKLEALHEEALGASPAARVAA